MKINQFEFFHGIVYVNGQLCYLSSSKIQNKEGAPELQIIVSFNKPDEAQSLYKERWQIETAFRALKSSGFNIEDTHLTDIDRVAKLFSLLLIAFVWASKVSIFLGSIKPIKVKKHGSKAKSFFKHEFTKLPNMLTMSNLDKFRECCLFLSGT